MILPTILLIYLMSFSDLITDVLADIIGNVLAEAEAKVDRLSLMNPDDDIMLKPGHSRRGVTSE